MDGTLIEITLHLSSNLFCPRTCPIRSTVYEYRGVVLPQFDYCEKKVTTLGGTVSSPSLDPRASLATVALRLQREAGRADLFTGWSEPGLPTDMSLCLIPHRQSSGRIPFCSPCICMRGARDSFVHCKSFLLIMCECSVSSMMYE